MTTPDRYRTLAGPGESLYKAKGSKHYGYAYPIGSEEEAATFVKTLRERHHKARHWCYAYRLGDGDAARWRANDDGEPRHSAGPPILGQIDAAGLTDVLVVVVRYFGGTKLGVGGLIDAYRTAAAEALAAAPQEERTRMRTLRASTDYTRLSDLMNAVKAGGWTIEAQRFEAAVELELSFRAGGFDEAYAALWLVLAEAYPGQERLDEDPPGYTLARAAP